MISNLQVWLPRYFLITFLRIRYYDAYAWYNCFFKRYELRKTTFGTFFNTLVMEKKIASLVTQQACEGGVHEHALGIILLTDGIKPIVALAALLAEIWHNSRNMLPHLCPMGSIICRVHKVV